MIAEVRMEVHNRCLNFRALDRLVKTEAFEQAMKLDPNNIWVQFALINGNVEQVEVWIDKVLTKDIGEMSLRELRQLASKLGVPYTSVTKDILLIRIQNARRSQKDAIAMSHSEE
jgi:hypothetical protein